MARKRKKQRDEKSVDHDYLERLNVLVDQLFQAACDKQMTWVQLAGKSGLSASTVHNLGERITRFPHYRTMELLARAVGGRLTFKDGEQAKAKLKISWTPESFRSKRKRVA
jgi:hypothetical protein